MGSPLRFGIVGVGKISEQYLEAFPSLPGVELVAISDVNAERAAAVAAEQGVEALSVDELMARPDIEAIVNLTIPAAHIAIDEQAIAAGKHVYGEKPLALKPAEALRMLEAANAHGVRVGSAPDTVLGTGIQTARALLDGGEIGAAIGASAFWAAPGHERWHPSPEFYYQPGGGPLFDMGPYYLTALITLLGPVVRVSGKANRSGRERRVETGPNAGSPIAVSVDTHLVAILEHASGVSSTVTMSFEVWASRQPAIEVFGTAGTIAVPDPNLFAEPVEIFRSGAEEWNTVGPLAGYSGAGRGYGFADMAHAIETDRPHRASGQLAYHVLEIMDAILVAAKTRSVVDVLSSVARPAPVPLDARPDSW